MRWEMGEVRFVWVGGWMNGCIIRMDVYEWMYMDGWMACMDGWLVWFGCYVCCVLKRKEVEVQKEVNESFLSVRTSDCVPVEV